MTCTHRWILETPKGETVSGRCRLCGEERRFPTSHGGRYNNSRPKTSTTKPTPVKPKQTSGHGRTMRGEIGYRG